MRSLFVELNLKRHDDGINAVSFNLDERYFVSGSEDRTCKIWQRKPYSVWPEEEREALKKKAEKPQGKDELTDELSKLGLQ